MTRQDEFLGWLAAQRISYVIVPTAERMLQSPDSSNHPTASTTHNGLGYVSTSSVARCALRVVVQSRTVRNLVTCS